MTKINELPEQPRERLRGEILGAVNERREQCEASLRQLTTYLGIVYTGTTAATLGFMASSAPAAKSSVVITALGLFVFAVISFAALLHRHYQLTVARDNAFAHLAQAFFHREADLEDLLSIQGQHTSVWLFRLLFWLPFSAFLVGIAAIVIAIVFPTIGVVEIAKIVGWGG